MILVLAENYPSKKNKYPMAYVHSRNMYYQKLGIKVSVINFRTKHSYNYDGIKVYSLKDFNQQGEENFELVISHAPNLKNHIKFIIKNLSKIKNILMVFHGHEALKTSIYYPKPYPYIKQKKLKNIIQNCYDSVKLPLLKITVKKLTKKGKLKLLFVSEWMRDNFCYSLNFDKSKIMGYSYVIPNNIHPAFLNDTYNYVSKNRMADFITIRPLDNSKYGIDIVRKFAIKNPQFQFHIYGKGDFFKYYSKPENITVFPRYFDQSELPNILNKYKAALMPTRLDAQGVMACEMATFGIPLITSDIPICREMLSSFENVFFMDNEKLNLELNEVFKCKQSSADKNLKFSNVNTVENEVKLIKQIKRGSI